MSCAYWAPKSTTRTGAGVAVTPRSSHADGIVPARETRCRVTVGRRTVDHRATPPLRRPRHAGPEVAGAVPGLDREAAAGHPRGRRRLRRDLDGRPGPGAGRHRPRPAV